MTSIPISPLYAARRVGCAVVYASALSVAGCASMAGVGGTTEFGCKAPAGVKCDSVSGTYYNALQQNLPSQQKSAPSEASREPRLLDQPVVKNAAPTAYSTKGEPTTRSTALALTPPADAPLRSPPRVLRLWIKPWEDSDGDFHSQSYVYVPIDTGRWLIDHYRSSARDAYAPIRGPRAAKGAAPTPDSAVTASPHRSGEDGPLFSGPPAAALVAPSFSGDGGSDGR